MVQRYDLCGWVWPSMSMLSSIVLSPVKDGRYVLYTDHLAVVRELVILCLDHGIISRGMACEYLGCAREDLDGILDQIATEAGEDGSDEIRNYSK